MRICALILMIAIPRGSLAEPLSTEFVVCSAYSKAMSKLFENNGRNESALLALTRANSLLKIAEALDAMERIPKQVSIELQDLTYRSLMAGVATSNDELRLISEYEKQCAEIGSRARKVIPLLQSPP